MPPQPGHPTEAGTYRLVVASADEAPYAARTLRLRAIRDLPDLVVDGPPLRVESPEPGQRFRFRVPTSEPVGVRLEASDVAVTGGGWTAGVHHTCSRDCWGGVFINQEEIAAVGSVPNPRRPFGTVEFEHGASGSLTLTLSRYQD